MLSSRKPFQGGLNRISMTILPHSDGCRSRHEDDPWASTRPQRDLRRSNRLTSWCSRSGSPGGQWTPHEQSCLGGCRIPHVSAVLGRHPWPYRRIRSPAGLELPDDVAVMLEGSRKRTVSRGLSRCEVRIQESHHRRPLRELFVFGDMVVIFPIR